MITIIQATARAAAMAWLIVIGLALLGLMALTTPVEVGDVITFRSESQALVMHRVIETFETSGTLRFRTQGDNNDDPDAGLVNEDRVERRLRWSVAGVGAWVAALQPPLGLIWLMAVPGI